MAHTFLSLDMNLIPQTTKDYVPTFWGGLFSNDNSRMLIDGYNDKREIVHPQSTFDSWLQWSDNPKEVQESILSSAIEYTSAEIKAEIKNPESIWYVIPAIEGDE